jgi:hypothetical protein
VADAANQSNNYARAGLWRAFNYEHQEDVQTYEGGSTPKTKTTNYYYDPAYQQGGGQYGNLSAEEVYDERGALVRTTRRWYNTRDDAANYLVDRVWGERVDAGNGVVQALTHTFYYDDIGVAAVRPDANTLGPRGRVSRVSRYTNVTPCCTYPLLASDVTYGYDAYGNRTTVKTYADYGRMTTATSWSAPGNGSAARTTTTEYDAVFHTFPVKVTNAKGHVERADYDYRMGTLVKVVGPNSSADGSVATGFDCRAASYRVPADQELTCAQYDVFGRLAKLIRPGDDTGAPTVAASYYDTCDYTECNPERPFRYLVQQKVAISTAISTVKRRASMMALAGRSKPRARVARGARRISSPTTATTGWGASSRSPRRATWTRAVGHSGATPSRGRRCTAQRPRPTMRRGGCWMSSRRTAA